MLIALPTGSAQETAQRAAATVERLRAERDAAIEPELQARLSFELGLVEHELGNNETAAQYFEAAVAANPALREAGERLLALQDAEAGATTDLGKILEALLSSAVSPEASTPEEQQWAVLNRAAHLAAQQRDAIGARALLEQWLAQHPDDVAGWLMMEIIAAQSNDGAARQTALSARARCADDPVWRALLLLDLSRLQRPDDPDAAKQSLESVLQTRTVATYRTLIALERLSRNRDDGAYSSALDARARLIAAGLRGEIEGPALGVPSNECSTLGYATTALIAAHAPIAQGGIERAAVLLDGALEALPEESLLLSLRLRLAEALGDRDTTVTLAERLLALKPSPVVGATLWLSIAEAHLHCGRTEPAIAALSSAVHLHGECWIARARLLTLLSEAGAQERLAELAEQGAALSSTAAGQAFAHFATAELCAAQNKKEAVELALSQALAVGADATRVERVRGFLSRLSGDQQERRRAIATLTELLEDAPEEQRDLRLQQLRTQLLEKNPEAAGQALDQLAQHPEYNQVVATLRAFLNGSLPARDTTAPLLQMAEQLTQPQWQQALRLLAARRAQNQGDLQRATAIAQTLRDRQPNDPLTTSYLSELLATQGQWLGSVEVLSQAADTCASVEERRALRLQAGLIAWRTGARHRAQHELQRVVQEGSDFPATTLAWCDGAIAAQSHESTRVQVRRAALQANAEAAANDVYCRIQQWAWSACSAGAAQSSEQSTIAQALQAMDQASERQGSLALAAALARALSDTGEPGSQARDAARVLLEKHCETPGSLTAAASYLECTERTGTATDRLVAARTWAHAEPSLAAACEWLALAHASRDRAQESKALLHLSALLPSDEAAAVGDSACIMSWLDGAPLESPNDASPLHAESALPGASPSDRAVALEAVLGMFPADAAITQTLLGTNHLEAGHFDEAELCFRAATQHDMRDAVAWDGLREVALRTQNPQLLAEALAALGDVTAQPDAASELWRRSSSLLLDTLNDEERGKYALARAVELDPTHTESYERLVQLVRRKRDSRWLVQLIDARLAVIASASERVKLYWDKARALRRLMDLEATLLTLEELTALEPDHLGALALNGEVQLARGDLPLACEQLEALALHHDAPGQQRLLSGLTASDLAASKLGDPTRALGILRQLCDAGIADLAVRERIVRIAAELGQWDLTVESLNELMLERRDSEGRIAAARLAIAIHRDHLNDPAAAANAVQALLHEAPEDAEALDFVLSGALPPEISEHLLREGKQALLGQLQHDPNQLESVLRLATIADALHDPALRQAALGGAVALGQTTPPIEKALRELAGNIRLAPNGPVTETQLAVLCDPWDGGPVAELCRLLAPELGKLLGPNLKSLGLTKKDRLAPGKMLVLAPAILGWTEALGLSEVEIFASVDDTNEILGWIDDAGMAFSVPAKLQNGGTPMQRQAIARQALGLRCGTSIVHHHSPAHIASLLSGLCAAAECPLPHAIPGAPAAVVDQLYGDLSRKMRKQVGELAREIADGDHNPLDWALASERSLDRIALLAVGNASLVQAAIPNATVGGDLQESAGHARAQALLAFALSAPFLKLQHELGMGPA